MKKDFSKELAELINKHSLEKEMRDTPDYKEKAAIAGLLKQINADASVELETDIPEAVKEVAEIVGKGFGRTC